VLFAEVSAFTVHKLLSFAEPSAGKRAASVVFVDVSVVTVKTEINQKNGVNCDDF
jgi:hypothetical protein